ncbi:MAG: AAA family ATPase [Blastocatellales bacterium]
MLLLQIPDPSLVILVGPSGAGKSTFAARHFKPTEIVSSDRCRALVCDDESDQSVNGAAFSLLHHIAGARLWAGRLTVIDATNLEIEARRRLLRIAGDHQAPTVAIAFNIPLERCLRQNLTRSERVVKEEVVGHHSTLLEKALANLALEGYARVYVLDETNLNDVVIERIKWQIEPGEN